MGPLHVPEPQRAAQVPLASAAIPLFSDVSAPLRITPVGPEVNMQKGES